MNDTSSLSKPDKKLLDPSATAEREFHAQAAQVSPRNGGGGSSSTKTPEADPGIVAQLRGGQKKTGYGNMTMVNGGAAATSNKSQPEPEKPKAVSRDWGMER